MPELVRGGKPVQDALALILFCLLTGLWAYLWISFSF